MPCDQILLQRLDFAQAKGHLDILEQSLREEGYKVQRHGQLIQFENNRVTGVYRNGGFDVRSFDYEPFNVDSVKRRFAKNVAKRTAKQYGWEFIDKGENRFELRKRI